MGDRSPGSSEAEGEGGEGFYIARSRRRPNLLASPALGGGSPSCKLSNAGELPEEVVKPRRAVVKDRGVRIGPRALQVERHHEDILGAEFRAWNAQRCEETEDGGCGNGSQQVRALKAVWLPSPPSCWTLLRSRGRGPVS
jgi:hypothetical protein